MSADWRVEVILRVGHEHTTSYAASKEATGGEAWNCKCGEKFKGDGALKNGRRHCATETVAELDRVAGVTA